MFDVTVRIEDLSELESFVFAVSKWAAERPNIRQVAVSAAQAAPSKSHQTALTCPPLDAVRNALQELVSRRDLKAGETLLGKFDAVRVSDIRADRYEEFIASCRIA